MMLRQLHNGVGRLEVTRSRHQPAKQCLLQRAPKRSAALLTIAAAGNGAVQEVGDGLELERIDSTISNLLQCSDGIQQTQPTRVLAAAAFAAVAAPAPAVCTGANNSKTPISHGRTSRLTATIRNTLLTPPSSHTSAHLSIPPFQPHFSPPVNSPVAAQQVQFAQWVVLLTFFDHMVTFPTEV
jgi:hypothetical protein